MRVLLISTPVTTHLSPMFPIAWALKSAGHDLLVAGHPDIELIAHHAGLSTWTVGDLFHVREQMAGHLMKGRRPIELGVYRDVEGNWDPVNKVWVDNARYMVRHYLALARDWRPDLIISDPVEFSGRIIGGLLGVPVVLHRWGIDLFGEQARRLAQDALFLTMADLGLTQLPEPALTLDPCPPSLQLKEAQPGVAIRHVPSNGPGQLPGWALSPPLRRRLCLTFGRLTVSLNGLPLLRRLLQAVAEIPDVEAVITLEREYHDVLGPVPECVRVTEPVPLDLFLSTCDAIVHHGGSGTFLSACSVGLPQLILPGFADSFVIGEQVEASGIGVSISRIVGQNNPDTLRKAMIAILEDRELRDGARRLASEIAAMPAPVELVGRLEELVGHCLKDNSRLA